MAKFEITGEWLTIDEVAELLNSGQEVVLSQVAVDRINKCREFLDTKVLGETPIYGINTGFGSLCNTMIPAESLEELQYNLVRSHACGMGERVPDEIVKIMLLFKAIGLSFGHSGVALETVERLLYFYNNNILPEVFQLGSLGASGDLAPLAHLSLPLIGEGRVKYKGTMIDAGDMLRSEGLEPLKLRSKEGLALLNGTQFMSAYTFWCVNKAGKLSEWADLIACVSLEAFDGRIDPFNPLVHEVRAHNGQISTAQNIRNILEGSDLINGEKINVQDPYSFRCIPQVHGASKDAIGVVKNIVEREINSVTDNPTVFPDDEIIVSAGNFHGQPLAINLDYLAISIAEIGSISERRTYKLVSGQRNLPAFLVANPGLHSGFMIPQYTAAGIVSQNKQLCTPASVDTIDSSNGQEDHVSMGANAATKAARVVDNLERILAIELLTAAQAFEFRRPGKSSERVEKLLEDYRSVISFVDEDRFLHVDMEKSVSFIQNKDPNGTTR